MSGWRGKIGRLLPKRQWRRAMDFSSRDVPMPGMSLASLRAEQESELKLAADQMSLPSHWLERERMLCLSPEASSALRERLAGKGRELVEAEKASHSAGFSAGWRCADVSRTAGRLDARLRTKPGPPDGCG